MRMEEATEENNSDDDKGNFNGGVEEDFQSSSSSSIFPQLKQSCLQLLQLHQNPNIASNASAPSQLLRLLRRSPPHSLQPFFEYVFFLFKFFFFRALFSLLPTVLFATTSLCFALSWSLLERLTSFFFFPFNVKVGSFICFVVLFHV